MRNSGSIRTKARGYLSQADRCEDPVFADELRGLARRLFEQADTLDVDSKLTLDPCGSPSR